MKEHRISFARVIDHENGIVEAIADEGVDITPDDLYELYDYMQGRETPAHGLLANRKNSYAFSFSSLGCLHKLVGVHAVAEVVHGKPRNPVIKALWPSFMKLQFFESETEALDWLHKVLNKEQ